MAYKVGTVLLEIKSDTAKLVSGMDKAEKSIYKLKKSFSDLVKAAAAIYGITKTFELLNSMIIETSAKFEKFSLILETLEGSSKKAQQDLEWIKKFAQTTPYEIDKVTEAFVKLKSYGFDAAKDLKVLGDTAAAMGKPLDSAVEAIADAVTGEFERLKEFGIKAYQQGNKVAFTWADASGKARYIVVNNNREVIESTLTAIWNSKYAGSMKKLSGSWNGILSNMKDAWTNFKGDTAKLSFKDAKKDLLVLKNVWIETLNDMKKPMASFESSVVKGFKNIVLGAAILDDSISDIFGVLSHGFKGIVYGIDYLLMGIPASVEDAINGVLGLLNKLPDWMKNKMGVKDFRINMGWSEKRDEFANASAEEFKKVKNIFMDNIVAGKTGETYAYWKKKFNEAEKEAEKNAKNTVKTQKEIGKEGQFNRNMLKAQTDELKTQKNVYEQIITLKQKDAQTTQQLIAKYQDEYISNFGTKEQQLEAWYKKEYIYIMQNLQLEKDRVKALKELNTLMAKKMEALQKEKELEKEQKQQQALGFDDNTYKAYKDLAKKFGEDSAKTFATGLSIFMKSKNFNDLFNNIGSAIASSGGIGAGVAGFFIQHTQDILSYMFDKFYDAIRNKYKSGIDSYQTAARDNSFRANAYNAFGQEGYGQIESLKAELNTIKANELIYKQDYELMKRSKSYKEGVQGTLETGSIALGTAAAAWFSGGAVLQGLNMAMDAKKWADEATGFSKFQKDFINSVNTLKQSIQQFADDLINLAGSVYKNISDYRSLYDKITGTNTYKLKQEQEALSLIGKYTTLSQTGVADLVQKILQSSADFVHKAVNATQNVKDMLKGEVIDKFGLSIDALNSKFKDSINIVAELIEKQREANKAFSDYIAELKKELGLDTTTSTINAQAAFAKAVQDYKSGKVDYQEVLNAAKEYRNVGGITADKAIISTLEKLTKTKTEDYLKNIAQAVDDNAIGLPEEQVNDLTNPEYETLDAIKDTKSILERILDIFSNPTGFFSGITDLLQKILDAILNIGSAIVGAIGGVVNGIVSNTTRAITVLSSYIGNVTIAIYTNAKKIIEGIVQGLASAIGSIYKGISNVGKFTYDLATGAIKWVGGSIGSAFSSVGNVVSSAWKSIKHVFGFAEGGYTGLGIGQKDSTGEVIAGVVHAGEWVAPRWMLETFPDLFRWLENGRATGNLQVPMAVTTPVNNINVSLNIEEIKLTNNILREQLFLQQKMYRLLQKFDEEGIKCIS